MKNTGKCAIIAVASLTNFKIHILLIKKVTFAVANAGCRLCAAAPVAKPICFSLHKRLTIA